MIMVLDELRCSISSLRVISVSDGTASASRKRQIDLLHVVVDPELARFLLVDPPHRDAATLGQHLRTPVRRRPLLQVPLPLLLLLPQDRVHVDFVPEAPRGGSAYQLPEIVGPAGRPRRAHADAPGHGGELPGRAPDVAVPATDAVRVVQAPDVQVAGLGQGPERDHHDLHEPAVAVRLGLHGRAPRARQSSGEKDWSFRDQELEGRNDGEALEFEVLGGEDERSDEVAGLKLPSDDGRRR